MKRIYLIILFLISLLTISCSMSKDANMNGADKAAFVTIKLNNSYAGFYGLMDNNEKIYISKISTKYTPVEGQRAVIYYNEYDNTIEGYKYNVHVYSIMDLPTDNVEKIENKPISDFSTDPINITRAWYGGGYMNIEFEIFVSKDESNKSYIYLIDSCKTTPTGNYPLVLTHKISPKAGDTKLVKGAKCFKLNNIAPEVLPIKNYDIYYKDLNNANKKIIVKIDILSITEHLPFHPQWEYYQPIN